MAKITIEGSITPAAGLARGERREVQDSDEVRRYVELGFANVVDDEGHIEPAPLPEPVKPPAKSASRSDWAEFLGEYTDVPVTDDRTRDELVGDFEVWSETHDLPAAED